MRKEAMLYGKKKDNIKNGMDMYCSKCNKVLIKRKDMQIKKNNIILGRCMSCNSIVEEYWK